MRKMWGLFRLPTALASEPVRPKPRVSYSIKVFSQLSLKSAYVSVDNHFNFNYNTIKIQIFHKIYTDTRI